LEILFPSVYHRYGYDYDDGYDYGYGYHHLYLIYKNKKIKK